MLMFTNKKVAYVWLALLVAVLYDVLFWQQGSGINLFLFTLLYSIGFIVLSAKRIGQVWSLALLIPLLVLSFDVFLFRNEVVMVLAPLLVVVLLFYITAILPLKNSGKHTFFLTKVPGLIHIDQPFEQLGKIKHDLFGETSHTKKMIKHVLIGIVIAVPILFIFGALFYYADDVFAQWVRQIEIEWVDLWRFLRTLAITGMLAGLYYVVADSHYELGEKTSKPMAFHPVVTSVVLGLVNLLFAVFVYIQLQYLFGSPEFFLAEGLTYAEYARKGFFELVWVVLFSGLLLFSTYRAFRAHKNSLSVKVLQILMIAQIGVIAASALWRLGLYVDAYGLTVLRLYTTWFVWFLLAVFAYGALSILGKFTFRTFFQGTLVMTLVALSAALSMNVDYMVAKHNVEKYLSSTDPEVTMDIYYLDTLSLDVIPAVLPLLESEAYKNDEFAYEALNNMIAEAKITAAEETSWQEYHRSTKRLQQLFPQN